MHTSPGAESRTSRLETIPGKVMLWIRTPSPTTSPLAFTQRDATICVCTLWVESTTNNVKEVTNLWFPAEIIYGIDWQFEKYSSPWCVSIYMQKKVTSYNYVFVQANWRPNNNPECHLVTVVHKAACIAKRRCQHSALMKLPPKDV